MPRRRASRSTSPLAIAEPKPESAAPVLVRGPSDCGPGRIAANPSAPRLQSSGNRPSSRPAAAHPSSRSAGRPRRQHRIQSAAQALAGAVWSEKYSPNPAARPSSASARADARSAAPIESARCNTSAMKSSASKCVPSPSSEKRSCAAGQKTNSSAKATAARSPKCVRQSFQPASRIRQVTSSAASLCASTFSPTSRKNSAFRCATTNPPPSWGT